MAAMFIRYKNYFGEGGDLVSWNPETVGYKPITTYYDDFGIAERFGKKAVKDTYKRAVNTWGHDIKWMTEVAMVLNWKTWEHAEDEWCDFYVDLFYKHSAWVTQTFTGEDLDYYYRTTD